MENCYLSQNYFGHWILLLTAHAGLVSLGLISFKGLFGCGWMDSWLSFFPPLCLRYNIWRNLQHPAEHHCKAHWCRILTPVGPGPSLVSATPFPAVVPYPAEPAGHHSVLYEAPCPGFQTCFVLFPVYSKTISKLLCTLLLLLLVSEHTEVSLYQHLQRWTHFKYWHCWQKWSLYVPTKSLCYGMSQRSIHYSEQFLLHTV